MKQSKEQMHRRRKARYDIGRQLKAARIAADMKQSDVCEALGISQQRLSRMEWGQASIPAEMVPEICKLLGVEMRTLIIGMELLNDGERQQPPDRSPVLGEADREADCTPVGR